ncbi:nitroreductase family protein [Haloflavibacter putidus]|uniref:Putative NAD(P)H nitroreductase n=1 Tax=Haloflavibacter putidus TaxID=2576776 RepID=A0A507ZFA2_9FLAO|nr:nitroreductase [Haloflavibacter putidus]TQD34794.1 nitroreductase [Haloflavibacter putidus]
MKINELIKKRRSVFPAQYNNKPISKDVIQQIVTAANWAPTHKKTEPWRFKVLQEEALLEFGEFLAAKYKATTKKYSAFKEKKILKKFEQSACVIVISFQRDPKERIPEWEEIASTAMAVQNMWLLATDLGIGAYWSSPALKEFTPEFFDFEEGEHCLGFFYMGYFDESLPEDKRIPIDEKVQWF